MSNEKVYVCDVFAYSRPGPHPPVSWDRPCESKHLKGQMLGPPVSDEKVSRFCLGKPLFEGWWFYVGIGFMSNEIIFFFYFWGGPLPNF